MTYDQFWHDEAFSFDEGSLNESSQASVLEKQLEQIELLLERHDYRTAWETLSTLLAGQPELMSQSTREQYADLWGTLGITVGLDGHVEESLSILRRAISEHRAAQDDIGEMIDWLNLGEMQCRLGDGASAIISLIEARKLAVAAEHQPGLEKAEMLLTNARRLSQLTGYGQNWN